MPRVTRAALRSQEMQEETDTAASVPLPLTPKPKARAPLGETSGNTAAAPENVDTSEENKATVKKGPGKGKKTAAKKATKPNQSQEKRSTVEVIEDDNQSQTSSAAEEACKHLLNGGVDADEIVLDERQTHNPSSAAANEASMQLSPNVTTPHSRLVQHSDITTTSDAKTNMEDTTVANIENHAPATMTNVDGLGITTAKDGGEEDSFVEQIKTRTPGKRISRIEDSVEALDALEEEIEKVDGLIPNTREVQSPVKTKKLAESSKKPKASTANSPMRVKKNTVTPIEIEAKKPATSVRPAASRPSMQPPLKKTSASTGGVANRKHDVSTRKQSTSSPTTITSSQPPLKKRVSSIHKAPFQPAKSTKPPTRAVFELPGEAVARKLKEQREERLKREEEKKPEQSVPKARLSHAPEVKLNAVTKARLSMAKGEPVNPTATQHGTLKAKSLVRTNSFASVGPNKRLSTLSVTKRSTKTPPANPSARVTRAPSLSAAATPRNPSVSSDPRPAPTGDDLANQKMKGKEVFGRTKVEIMEREKERKEKDEAVKKARAEAAERGRAASRAWAEKQKLRKMEAAKANGEAKAVEV